MADLTADELTALKRPDLNAQAIKAGVDEPDKLANKGEVVNAILAKRSPQPDTPAEPEPADLTADEGTGTDDPPAPPVDPVPTSTSGTIIQPFQLRGNQYEPGDQLPQLTAKEHARLLRLGLVE